MKTVMNRPLLNPQISAEDFLAYYWLKEELAAFCRALGISTAGSKQELTQRICDYLSQVPVQPSARRPKKAPGKMPVTFTRETVIGPGFRCSQALRAFFETEIGPAFHFNGVMRDFIQNGQGKTLQQAIDRWRQQTLEPRSEKAIEPQFEYNRHVRQFFAANPGKTLRDAIASWEAKKARRKTETR
jgi:hypothetical protein